MFPGVGAQIYRNEVGEPLGWDYPDRDDPWTPDDDYDPWADAYEDEDYEDEEDDIYE